MERRRLLELQVSSVSPCAGILLLLVFRFSHIVSFHEADYLQSAEKIMTPKIHLRWGLLAPLAVTPTAISTTLTLTGREDGPHSTVLPISLLVRLPFPGCGHFSQLVSEWISLTTFHPSLYQRGLIPFPPHITNFLSDK